MSEKLMTLEQRLEELATMLGTKFAEERHRSRVELKEIGLEVREAVLAMKGERDKMVSEIVEQVLARLDTATSKRH